MLGAAWTFLYNSHAGGEGAGGCWRHLVAGAGDVLARRLKGREIEGRNFAWGDCCAPVSLVSVSEHVGRKKGEGSALNQTPSQAQVRAQRGARKGSRKCCGLHFQDKTLDRAATKSSRHFVQLQSPATQTVDGGDCESGFALRPAHESPLGQARRRAREAACGRGAGRTWMQW